MRVQAAKLCLPCVGPGAIQVSPLFRGGIRGPSLGWGRFGKRTQPRPPTPRPSPISVSACQVGSPPPRMDSTPTMTEVVTLVNFLMLSTLLSSCCDRRKRVLRSWREQRPTRRCSRQPGTLPTPSRLAGRREGKVGACFQLQLLRIERRPFYTLRSQETSLSEVARAQPFVCLGLSSQIGPPPPRMASTSIDRG